MKAAGKVLAVAMTELFGMIEKKEVSDFVQRQHRLGSGSITLSCGNVRTHGIRDSARGILKRNESEVHV